MERTLITAETILPISSPPINGGAVLVVDGKIGEIGKASNLRKAHKSIKTLDLGRGILLPGFINAHTHLELGWIKKRVGKPNGFIGWLQDVIRAKKREIKGEEIERSVRDGIKTLIESGVTTVGEISSFGRDKSILRGSGLRTVLFVELFDRHRDSWNTLSFEKGETFEERPFPHAPYSCSPDLLKNVFRFCRKEKTPLGIHIAESPEETVFVRGEENGFDRRILPMVGRRPFPRKTANTPFQYIKGLKPFKGTKVTAVHMVHVLPEEVEEIGKHDLGIVLCPRSNYLLRVGCPPVKLYTGLKRIGIGTDGLSSNLNLDFFEELRFFYLTFGGELGKEAPFFTVYLATLGGARALFLEDRTGSIEKGKEADLIFLTPTHASSNPYLSVISSCKGDVKLVMVNGRTVYPDTYS